MVILQNRDAVLDRPLDFTVGVLGQHLLHILNGSGSVFFVTRFHRGLTKCQVEVSCNTDRVNVLSLNTLN